MTILSIATKVAPAIGIEVPTAFIGQTSQELIELSAVATEAMDRILAAHFWERLMAIETITGDASTTAWPLPSDYNRMDEGAQLWSSALQTPLEHIPNRNIWLGHEVQDFDYVINAWSKFGNAINIKPALASAVTVKYWYQKNKPILDTDGTTYKTDFTNDADTIALTSNNKDDERLMKLAMIWVWKEEKGQAYQEKMADFNDLLSKMILKDGGASTIRIGSRRVPQGVRVAYPQAISG